MNKESGVSESGRSHATVHVFDVFRLEPARRSLKRLDGNVMPVSGKAFDTLVYLVQHAGEVVDRRVLIQAVWPRRVVEDNNVNQAIAVLRRALGAQHIVTVAGRGYQFVTPVHVSQTELHTPAPTARASQRWPRPALGFLAAAAVVLGVPAALLLDDGNESASGLGPIVATSPLTTYPGTETTPSLSPDGTRVAFAWSGDANHQGIYVARIGAGAPVRLTAEARPAAEYPAWSPDGQQIAFIRRHDAARFDVAVIPSSGGHETRLYSGERQWISREGFPLLAWTPDNRQIWFTTRRQASGETPSFGLHRLRVGTGEVEPLDLGSARDDYDTSPAISPDGTWLAFVRYRGGERLNQIMAQRLGPGFVPVGNARVVAAAALHHSLAWAPSSDRLWFVKGAELVEWSINGSLRVAATTGPGVALGEAAFSRTRAATRAAAVTQRVDTDIFVLALDPETHAALGPPMPRVRSTTVEYHPQFSRDGKQLAFVSDRSGDRALWIADRDGARPRQVTDLKELITGFPRWSPDGTRLAFHTSARNEQRVVYTVAADGGPPKRLVNACCPTAWSADGRYVYGQETGGVNRVARINVANGAVDTLFEGELAVESADGRFLLYSKQHERGWFRRALDGAPAENAEEKLVSDYRPAIGGIAPTADGFFYVGLEADDEPRALRFYDSARKDARDIWPLSHGISIGLTVSPDGRELLYAAESGEPSADIVLLELGAPGRRSASR